MRHEPIGTPPTSMLLILEAGDSIRCDEGEIPLIIEMGMSYTLTVKEDE